MSEAADFALWNVRIAQTREERKRIFRFRFDNHFSEYGRWPSLVQPSVRSIREAADEVAVFFFADSDGKVVGATRLRIGPVPPELRTELFAGRFNGFRLHELALADQIAVARAFRRAGLLDSLVRAVVGYCEKSSVQFLFSHAQEELARQLKHHGFREHALTFNHPELGPRVPLVRIIGGEASEKWFETEFPEVEAQ
jgi:GNAT superfamily N-acetyltransferase